MSTPTYTPRAGSLASQVISFFRNNPDEELLLDDITDKFACTRGNVHTLLSDAVKAELLARSRNADGDYLYKPGRACGTYAAPAAAIAATSAKTLAANRQFQYIDVNALQVDEGLIYTPRGGSKGASKWDKVFAKLTKAGQSVEMPRAFRDRLYTHCSKLNKITGRKTWAVSTTSPSTCRLWRLL